MNVIEVANLTKVYRIYVSPRHRLKELVSFRERKYHREFYALTDVSFKVESGQTVGIIGQNGSGKSTLLQIICGVLHPTSGSVRLSGRISALLELGTGFNPEFTGRENVYMNGALMGFSRHEMEHRFPEIEAFADIGDFIDQPVKSYSTGMLVRLAFAAAVNVEPDILIIDEALSVGDVLFQAKCFSKFQKFKEKGTTILFVTHSLDLISTYCDHAILLNRGKTVAFGKPKEVVDEYNRLITSKNSHISSSKFPKGLPEPGRADESEGVDWNGLFRLNPNENRYGSRRAEIIDAGVFTPRHEPVQVLHRNCEYLIKIKVHHRDRMHPAIVAYSIKDPKGTILCGTNTHFQDIGIENMERGDVILVTFRQHIRINPGDYLLSVGTAGFEAGEYVVYDRRYDYMAIQIVADQPRVGLFDPQATIEWIRLRDRPMDRKVTLK